MKTKEKIEIMIAHLEGKIIEKKLISSDQWELCKDPSWAWDAYDYRIRPEHKYRPLRNADEAFHEAQKHGFWIKMDYEYVMPINFSDRTVYAAENDFSYEELVDFCWADDNTTCGILEKAIL